LIQILKLLGRIKEDTLKEMETLEFVAMESDGKDIMEGIER
jgi:hypothetical protein